MDAAAGTTPSSSFPSFNMKSLDDSLHALAATGTGLLTFSSSTASSLLSASRLPSFRNKIKVQVQQSHPSELNALEFKEFVYKTLPNYVNDWDLVRAVQMGATELVKSERGDGSSGEIMPSLQEIELCLLSVLKYAPSLPALVVAQLHSFRGLVFAKLDDQVHASESFLRALWIQTHNVRSQEASKPKDAQAEQISSSIESAELLLEISMTEHRLGVSIGRSGQHVSAIVQMKRAIESYEKMIELEVITIRDGRYVAAREDLHEFQEDHQLSLLKATRAHSIVRPDLRRCRTMNEKTKSTLMQFRKGKNNSTNNNTTTTDNTNPTNNNNNKNGTSSSPSSPARRYTSFSHRREPVGRFASFSHKREPVTSCSPSA